MIFCSWTPASELATKWRNVEAKDAETAGWRYRVVELGGRQIKSLVSKNAWAGPCGGHECMVCATVGRGQCRRPGCTYRGQTLRA